MKTELNRRTWLTAIMALPLLKWTRPDSIGTTSIGSDRPGFNQTINRDSKSSYSKNSEMFQDCVFDLRQKKT